ncbi:hypothetical protein ARMGADRAFT_1101884 [Armillaria gallica]|uniref:Uncharacterized protein n=1 Tax=Armillaria gallica TaxID=47427 RepID=A0A2H3DHU5_ARMGA|nr:hypothetical protein ARMGADRAFT_1101884 [Armillaria gallica]
MPECEPDSTRAPADTGMVYVYSGIAERYACDCLSPVTLPSSIAREHVIEYNGTTLTVKDIKGCPSGFEASSEQLFGVEDKRVHVKGSKPQSKEPVSGQHYTRSRQYHYVPLILQQQIERGHSWKDVGSEPPLIVISRKMRSSDSYSRAGDLQRIRRNSNMLKVKKSEQEEL